MWPELVQQTKKTGEVMCFPTNTGKKLTRMEVKKWLSLANVNRTGINDPQLSQRWCVVCFLSFWFVVFFALQPKLTAVYFLHFTCYRALEFILLNSSFTLILLGVPKEKVALWELVCDPHQHPQTALEQKMSTDNPFSDRCVVECLP